MSDNESESSCISALEDISLTGTTPTAEPDENIFEEAELNLSDEDQSEQPTFSGSTTQSYHDCLSLEDDLSSRKSSRNPTPECWESLVLEDNVAKQQDDGESLKSAEITDESIVKETLVEQGSTNESPTQEPKQETLEKCADEVESPKKSKIKDKSILKKLLTKHECDVESAEVKQQTVVKSRKSEERLAEQASTGVSPTKKQKKNKRVAKETLKKNTDVVESPTKVQQADDPIVAKQQNVVKSRKLAEQANTGGVSPTKKQKKNEPTDTETLDECAVEVKSPEKSEIKDESILKKLLTKHECDVESPTKVAQANDLIVESPKSEKTTQKSTVEEGLAEETSAEESPTKEQKQDAHIEEETLEKDAVEVESPKKSEIIDESILQKLLTKHVESPTEVQQAEDLTVAKRQNVVESPKSDTTIEKSTVEEGLAEQGCAEESPTREQKQDAHTDEETLEEDAVEVKSPEKSEIKDESILKNLLTKHESGGKSPTKVQQADDLTVKKRQNDAESPKSDKTTEKSNVKEGLAEETSAEESPTKEQKQDARIDKEALEENAVEVESPEKSEIKDKSILKKLLAKDESNVESPIQDVVESPKSEKLTQKSIVEAGLAEKGAVEVEPPEKSEIKDKSILKKLLTKDESNVESPIQDVVESPKSEKIAQKSIVEAGLAEKDAVEVKPPEKSEIKDKSILKKLLTKDESNVESPIQDVVESPKSEKIAQKSIVEAGLAEKDAVEVEPPEKSQIKDKSILEKLLTKHESNGKSSKVQQGVAKHQDVVESPKSGETKEELVVKRRLEGQESEVESPTKKQRDNVGLPKPEEKIKCESPTKKQKEDKSIDTAVIADLELSEKNVLTDKTKSTTRPLLDKEYFEYIFKRFYKTNCIRVDECIGDDASSIQPSLICDVTKFTLIGYKNFTKKFRFNVIVKQLGTDKKIQELFKTKIAAKNEEIAYNTIFPNLSMYGISLPVPMCFSADDEQIVVQDLCGIKYKDFEKQKGFITIKECGYALEALAKFHAASFVLKYKNNDKLQEIKNLPKNTLYHGIKKSPLLEHQEKSLEKILSVHTSRAQSEENLSKVRALKYLIKVAKDDIKDLLLKEQDDYVFCHGDLLLTNFLFKLKDARLKKKDVLAEMDIKLIDFQNVRFGSVASDLVYLLFVNLKPDDYIDKKEDLLMIYFNFLKRNVIDCGVGDNFKLTYEWLEKEIDRFTEYGIIYALWILPMLENKDQTKKVTQEVLDDSSKTIVYNERMKKWVDYYSTIYEKKFEK